MVKKIVLSIFLSFMIALTVFIGMMIIPEKKQEQVIGLQNYEYIHKEFFSKKNEENKNEIFILGSSYTQALNTTEINSIIQPKCSNCYVYNLSVQGDTIKKRNSVMDIIISANPKMIIYGISELDFAKMEKSEFENPNSVFPNIQEIISSEITEKIDFEFLKIPTSPKDKTWNVIRQINKDESTNKRFNPYPDTPFLKILKASTIIVSESELRSLASNIPPLGKINNPQNNDALKNLKEILIKVKENDIKVIFFIVPHHEYLISAESNDFKKSFTKIKNELINSTQIYPRSEEYSQMSIWHDLSHVAVNDKALIYSEDIAKIILKELET